MFILGHTALCGIGAMCKLAENYAYSSRKKVLDSTHLQSSLHRNNCY